MPNSCRRRRDRLLPRRKRCLCRLHLSQKLLELLEFMLFLIAVLCLLDEAAQVQAG